MENLIISLIIFLFFLLIALNFYAALWFKKEEGKYEELLSEFVQRGLELDSVTKFSANSGFSGAWQKIIYFVRLYKGVKIYRYKNVQVNKKTYRFIQAQPDEKIKWILKLSRFYNFIFILTALFFCLLVFFINYY